MEILAFILHVIPLVTSITVSSNGNSPEVKMVGGMMVDMQQDFAPSEPRLRPAASNRKIFIEKDVKIKDNSSLSINERYRRLIPYMTFYYANDLVSGKPELVKNNVEVEKVQIVEHPTQQQRHPKIVYSHNIPRYQGNRISQYNIASAHPIKQYYYKDLPHQYQGKYSPNHGPQNVYQEYERPIIKPIKVQSSPFVPPPVRKPYYEHYNHEELDNIRYYIGDKPQSPKYKLVPYEQTPPVKVSLPKNENYESKRLMPVPVQVPVHAPKDHVVIKPRPVPLQYYYETSDAPQPSLRKQPVVVSESYYDNRQPHPAITQPVIEGGFKPIINRPAFTTESVIPSTPASLQYIEDDKYETVQVLDAPVGSISDDRDVYQDRYFPKSNRVSLTELINVLQYNRTIPKTITKENVGSSIRTLIHVLNTLKAYPEQHNDVEMPVLSTPKPFVTPTVVVEVTPEPIITTPASIVDADINSEHHLAHVTTPSQHLDDYPSSNYNAGSTSQRFPLPITSDAEGGTPGRPGVDYPTMTVIPPTRFNCKTQRYKGFFADPETRCQVWHYCDLNGGQASFLCPNGTIFSQAALTCDWWFNVKCDSTTQLYVLNESLYKFILPHSPKFPEDYSGPLVDKYLTLKFKEMEEQFKKNKNKQATEKSDSDEVDTESSTESDQEGTEESTSIDKMSAVSEASVIVESSGSSGNVQRLQDEK